MATSRPGARLRDYVRCQRCGRLCQRSSAVELGGFHYGPDCALRVYAIVGNEQSPDDSPPDDSPPDDSPPDDSPPDDSPPEGEPECGK